MKTVIEMAKQADIEWDLIDEDEGRVWYITQAGLERLVRADEREACAKVCGDLHLEGEDNTGLAADLIRAKGRS